MFRQLKSYLRLGLRELFLLTVIAGLSVALWKEHHPPPFVPSGIAESLHENIRVYMDDHQHVSHRSEGWDHDQNSYWHGCDLYRADAKDRDLSNFAVPFMDLIYQAIEANGGEIEGGMGHYGEVPYDRIDYSWRGNYGAVHITYGQLNESTLSIDAIVYEHACR